VSSAFDIFEDCNIFQGVPTLTYGDSM